VLGAQLEFFGLLLRHYSHSFTFFPGRIVIDLYYMIDSDDKFFAKFPMKIAVNEIYVFKYIILKQGMSRNTIATRGLNIWFKNDCVSNSGVE